MGTNARAELAESNPSAEELAPFLTRAAEHGAGLCPVCFAEVSASYPPFPAPLAVGPGRIAGNGFVVEVSDSHWLRRVRIATPTAVPVNRRDRRWLSPRAAGVIAALPIAFLSLACALLLPRSVAAPWRIVLVLTTFMLIVNAVVAMFWRPQVSRTTRVFDVAWSMLARRLLGTGDAALFLARLAAASPGRGKRSLRAGVLADLREWANAAPPTDEFLQLRAAVAVLQVEDASRLGRDRVVGIVDLIVPVFQSRESLAFAEYVLTVFLEQSQPPTSQERSRLRVLLIGAAFEALLTPRDLLDLWAVAPRLKRAMLCEPSHRLGLLFGAWTAREAMTLPGVESVFRFCRTSPNQSGTITAATGDLLFVCRLAEELGLILVCGRGVVIGDAIASSPASVVAVHRIDRPGDSPFELRVGPHRFPLTTPPHPELVPTIRELLRFRHDVLLPPVEHYLEPQSEAARYRILRPLGRMCTSCGREAVVAQGHVGVELV